MISSSPHLWRETMAACSFSFSACVVPNTCQACGGGRRTTRVILVSQDEVVEWRTGSETASPVWHVKWGATQMFCQIIVLDAQMRETVKSPADAEHPWDVLVPTREIPVSAVVGILLPLLQSEFGIVVLCCDCEGLNNWDLLQNC